MKKIFNLISLSLIVLTATSKITFAQTLTYKDNAQQCFGTIGCFLIPTTNPNVGMYQIAINDLVAKLAANPSLITNGGFTGSITSKAEGSQTFTSYFQNNVILYYTCTNGDTQYFGYNFCPNGAVNAPTCNSCASGSTYKGSQCVCNNGASNAPVCNQCGDGLTMSNNLCQCTNGANNPPSCNQCPAGSNMTNGQCVCGNGAVPQSNCTQCPADYTMFNNKCVPGCSITNVCGQKAQGVMINGTCSMPDGSNANNTCIQNFTFSSDSVNPNGSVDFSWSIVSAPNVSSRCGFVDLTTPIPRPIPGLQNLDPSVDTARISSIQTTTRFCLICQFYSLLNNATLGNAAVHQWVRVVRIGEQ